MALKDLKSDLSWYGKSAPGFKPNADRSDTDFKVNDDSTISAVIQGYGIAGAAKSFRQAISSDKFIISDQGDSSRAAQLGSGTRFPIGPEGQIHKFDKTRTGFSDKVKYSDQYGVKFGNAGLADTYTINSPIDDMYNKFKVRDEVYDPFGYAKPPFILRGIQQDDNSDPQRWGTAGVFDIPRGGVVTAAERAALDAVRIGKFLVRPPGLVFLAKQIGLQLTNPNTEGVNGLPKALGQTKLYDPLSSITNAVGGTLGLRTDRHFPILKRNDESTYEGVINSRSGDAIISNNRLVLLRNELLGSASPATDLKKGLLGAFQTLSNFVGGDRGVPIASLTQLTGPGSLLGIGATTIRRYSNTSLARQNETGLSLDEFIAKGGDYHFWNYGKPYISTRGESGTVTQQQADDTKKGLGPTDSLKQKVANPETKSEYGPDTSQVGSTTVGTETPNNEVAPYDSETKYTTDPIEENSRSLEQNKTNWKEINPDRGGDGTALPGGGFAEKQNNANARNDYIRMAYGQIPVRQPGETRLIDFREQIDYEAPHNDNKQAGFAGWGSDRKIDEIDESIDDSLIKFSIGSTKFKAYIGTLSDNFAPGWNGTADQGRADSRYLYESFERTISTDFIVPIYSLSQRQDIWTKLQSLARLTYPVYGGSGFYGQATTLTIGDMYSSLGVIITDLSYDWDNETPWEITDGIQAPFYTNVSISFTVLDNKPNSGTTIYSNIAAT